MRDSLSNLRLWSNDSLAEGKRLAMDDVKRCEGVEFTRMLEDLLVEYVVEIERRRGKTN